MKTLSRFAIPLLAATLASTAVLFAQTVSPAYNKSQQKGSHNTEQRDETLSEALKFDMKMPYQAGVRNLEFDLVLSDEFLGPNDDWASTLQHGGAYNWKLATLRDALLILHNWHLANPGQDVVTVSLDLKNAPGDDATYTRKVEQTFVETLGREDLYTPGMLQGDYPTLLEGARAQGWPTIDKLKGKFILVFTGADSDKNVTRRRATTRTSLPTIRTATGCSSASRSARGTRASWPSGRRRPAGSPPAPIHSTPRAVGTRRCGRRSTSWPRTR
ncbi:MAG: hypothetical protein DMF53_14685 [Acidobacteria bacterium]|nr:MAG: hypothetical protein DMF53_14685 [Acidobacteriota bacterium]